MASPSMRAEEPQGRRELGQIDVAAAASSFLDTDAAMYLGAVIALPFLVVLQHWQSTVGVHIVSGRRMRNGVLTQSGRLARMNR